MNNRALSDRAFVEAAVEKLQEVGLPIVELHTEVNASCAAVLIRGDHYEALLAMVPQSEAATAWIMQHEHIGVFG